ncbi:GAF domain-containing protein [Pedobacter westerhofensis]|uniref:GAF domain-containing protein n=1 Tax=Pedobacter westerhofensis TaxID=425512 RepID=A0A521BBQ5_9SPHI|nr:GAF domain-containing protein [Pedobacter westerhofensis]SMO44527.1 GAF domain-containing protein [Pedobacter westerhofensis]
MAEDKNYDAEFCGHLAIHQTNSIQDYGCLLVLERSSLQIIQGSENTNIIILKDIKDLIGQHISTLLSAADLDRLQTEVNKGFRNRVPFTCSANSNGTQLQLNILLHVNETVVLLEIEKGNQDSDRSFSAVFQEVRSFISVLETNGDLYEVCHASIAEIRRLAGFDGIRMYRFDEEWNGTVIAEEITSDLESYMGQTFPASDVPKQARAMYLKNPYRLIPNRNYHAYKLFPVINPVTNGFLDLSDCNLRSISAVHLEYMANMNVTASMSIRVLVDGRLWGLISCHHTSSMYINKELRSIFEWLSMEISYRISSVIKAEEMNETATMLKLHAGITESIFTNAGIATGLLEDKDENLLALFNSTGFAINLNGRLFASGDVPAREDLENLFLWAAGKAFVQIYATHGLKQVYDEAEAYPEIASGLLVIPIDPLAGEFLMCFRPEVLKSIKWGGNPNEAIKFEKDGVTYHPRNSFNLWLETVHGHSEPWTKNQLEAAEALRNFLTSYKAAQVNN